MTSKLILNLLLLSCGIGCIDCCDKELAGQPVAAALLDLHTGDDCSIPKLNGFQQLAVVEATVKEINSNKDSPLKIGLQVFDTCSSSRGAVAAAMHALVASLQTCLKSPLFSGFIGPENESYLKAIRNFTGSFNFSHIVPYAFHDDDNNDVEKRTFHITLYPVISFAQAVTTVISDMNIKSPLFLNEDSIWATNLSYAIVENYEKSELSLKCEVKISKTVFNSSTFEDAIKSIDSHDSIVIAVESEELIGEINKVLDAESVQIPVIIAFLHSSSQNLNFWKPNHILISQVRSHDNGNGSSGSSNSHKYIQNFIQDSSHICSKYKLSGCDDGFLSKLIQDEYDWSLDSYETSLHAVSEGLRFAHRVKCVSQSLPCLSPSVVSQLEWHLFLKMGVDQVKKNNLPSYLIKTGNGSLLLKSAKIVNGVLTKFTSLPEVSVIEYCPKVTHVPSSYVPAISMVDVWFSAVNAQLTQVIATGIGAVFGLICMFIMVSICVYQSFKMESKSSSQSSYTMESQAGSRGVEIVIQTYESD